jgi:prepilin-type processing-associated H-X9-DG protein
MARILPYIEQGNLYNQASAWAGQQTYPVQWHLPPPNGTPGYAWWSSWGGYLFGLEAQVPQNPAIATVVPTYLCPSENGATSFEIDLNPSIKIVQAITNYQGISGLNYTTSDGCLAANHMVRFADILDGTSNTLLVGERTQSKTITYGAYYAGCGQFGPGLPTGDEQRGSGDVVLGVREIFGQASGDSTLDACPPGPYHFQPPNLIGDATGKINQQCDQFHYWSNHPGGANFLYADGSTHFLVYSFDNIMPAMATRSGGEVFEQP